MKINRASLTQRVTVAKGEDEKSSGTGKLVSGKQPVLAAVRQGLPESVRREDVALSLSDEAPVTELESGESEGQSNDPVAIPVFKNLQPKGGRGGISPLDSQTPNGVLWGQTFAEMELLISKKSIQADSDVAVKTAAETLQEMAQTTEGREAITVALTGKSSGELSALERTRVGQFLTRLATKGLGRIESHAASTVSKKDIAAGLVKGTALPEGVDGAATRSKDGKDQILLSRHLDSDQRAETALEEVGEVLAARAADAGVKVAPGDVGSRIAAAQQGNTLTKESSPGAFTASTDDKARVVLNGEALTANAKQANHTPKWALLPILAKSPIFKVIDIKASSPRAGVLTAKTRALANANKVLSIINTNLNKPGKLGTPDLNRMVQGLNQLKTFLRKQNGELTFAQRKLSNAQTSAANKRLLTLTNALKTKLNKKSFILHENGNQLGAGYKKTITLALNSIASSRGGLVGQGQRSGPPKTSPPKTSPPKAKPTAASPKWRSVPIDANNPVYKIFNINPKSKPAQVWFAKKQVISNTNNVLSKIRNNLAPGVTGRGPGFSSADLDRLLTALTRVEGTLRKQNREFTAKQKNQWNGDVINSHEEFRNITRVIKTRVRDASVVELGGGYRKSIETKLKSIEAVENLFFPPAGPPRQLPPGQLPPHLQPREPREFIKPKPNAPQHATDAIALRAKDNALLNANQKLASIANSYKIIAGPLGGSRRIVTSQEKVLRQVKDIKLAKSLLAQQINKSTQAQLKLSNNSTVRRSANLQKIFGKLQTIAKALVIPGGNQKPVLTMRAAIDDLSRPVGEIVTNIDRFRPEAFREQPDTFALPKDPSSLTPTEVYNKIPANISAQYDNIRDDIVDIRREIKDYQSTQFRITKSKPEEVVGEATSIASSIKAKAINLTGYLRDMENTKSSAYRLLKGKYGQRVADIFDQKMSSYIANLVSPGATSMQPVIDELDKNAASAITVHGAIFDKVRDALEGGLKQESRDKVKNVLNILSSLTVGFSSGMQAFNAFKAGSLLATSVGAAASVALGIVSATNANTTAHRVIETAAKGQFPGSKTPRVDFANQLKKSETGKALIKLLTEDFKWRSELMEKGIVNLRTNWRGDRDNGRKTRYTEIVASRLYEGTVTALPNRGRGEWSRVTAREKLISELVNFLDDKGSYATYQRHNHGDRERGNRRTLGTVWMTGFINIAPFITDSQLDDLTKRIKSSVGTANSTMFDEELSSGKTVRTGLIELDDDF